MTARRTVPNIKSHRAAETSDFFVDLLGFEVAMDLGWVVTLASPTNPSAQVTIIADDPPWVASASGSRRLVSRRATAATCRRSPR